MSHYDLGNINREKDYSLYQIGRTRKQVADDQAAKAKEENVVKQKLYEQKQTDANSLEALGNYGLAFSGLNKKTDVSALGLSLHDQVTVGKYVTPEQQARISEGMMKYFA